MKALIDIEKILEEEFLEDLFSFEDDIAAGAFVSNDISRGTYATYIDFKMKRFFCSCLGFRSHKTPCKHIKTLAYYCLKKNLITRANIKEVFGDNFLGN